MQAVQIRCKAAVNLDLVNLTPLQGDLKELSESNFNKLKQSILRHGIPKASSFGPAKTGVHVMNKRYITATR